MLAAAWKAPGTDRRGLGGGEYEGDLGGARPLVSLVAARRPCGAVATPEVDASRRRSHRPAPSPTPTRRRSGRRRGAAVARRAARGRSAPRQRRRSRNCRTRTSGWPTRCAASARTSSSGFRAARASRRRAAAPRRPPLRPPQPVRKSDAFDPNATPNAAGAPQPLGTTAPSAPLSGSRSSAARRWRPLDLAHKIAEARAAPAPARRRDAPTRSDRRQHWRRFRRRAAQPVQRRDRRLQGRAICRRRGAVEELSWPPTRAIGWRRTRCSFSARPICSARGRARRQSNICSSRRTSPGRRARPRA